MELRKIILLFILIGTLSAAMAQSKSAKVDWKKIHVVWITALGHDKKDYSDPTYVQHLFQGITFVAQQSGQPDFKKAYAISKDDAIRY
jgi:hypothetical protein